jgi:predicted ATPase
MIKLLKIKNFKSIKTKDFKLKNLNLQLGLNGMGKSSFIQSLLLLKQSKSFSGGQLNLQGEYVNIGTTKDALYQYAKKGENLSFEIQFDDSDLFSMEFDYKIEADYFRFDPKSNIYGESNEVLEKIEKSLFNSNFQYLNANRIEPKSIYNKSYSNVVNDNNVGNNGEYTAHYIEIHGNDDILFDNLLHKDTIVKDTTTNTDIINRTLINQINLWMGEISPGVNVRTTSISSEFVLLEYVFKQPNFGNTNRFKPENVGFGITYGLPIVTALLASKPGELIIIENPESHIHPRGQAELGKLIAKTAMNDVQIIVETHSDHILNGIRVAVKEGEIDKDKVAIFYYDKVVEASEQHSKIIDIQIDKNGELSEYPKNMLDEWSNQLFKLI